MHIYNYVRTYIAMFLYSLYAQFTNIHLKVTKCRRNSKHDFAKSNCPNFPVMNFSIYRAKNLQNIPLVRTTRNS